MGRENAEIRSFPTEVRATDGGTIVGYAAVTGQVSEVRPRRFEMFEPGAFRAALQKEGRRDVRALWQHDPTQPIAREGNGTLQLMEDDHGLRVEITPSDTSAGRDALESIRRGDVDQMSIAFDYGRRRTEEIEPYGPVKVVETVDTLWEVSPVTWAAYPQTEVGVRALQDVDADELEAELARMEAEIAVEEELHERRLAEAGRKARERERRRRPKRQPRRADPPEPRTSKHRRKLLHRAATALLKDARRRGNMDVSTADAHIGAALGRLLRDPHADAAVRVSGHVPYTTHMKIDATKNYLRRNWSAVEAKADELARLAPGRGTTTPWHPGRRA